jgi:uncharacterized protein (DUF952 family)
MRNTIFKLCTEADWRQAERAGMFLGTEVDRRDGYIHFSAADQLAETAAKHFPAVRDLVLVAVDGQSLAPRLKWEPSRGGALFPHLYGSLPLPSVLWVKRLLLDASGRHVLPDLDDGPGR